MIRLKRTIIPLLFFFISISLVVGKECTISKILVEKQCGDNEWCRETKQKPDVGECECISGFVRNGDKICVNNEPLIEGGSPWGLWLFCILLLLVLVIAAVYLNRKYDYVGWIRYKINQRYNSNYDDVMIGQDDD